VQAASIVYELLFLLLLALAVGVARPHWSSLGVALVAGAAVAMWAYNLEPIPGEAKGAADVAWAAVVGVMAAVPIAVAGALGVLIGRRLRRSLVH
jgi:hypothetical protein